jgi:hypothetical protein
MKTEHHLQESFDTADEIVEAVETLRSLRSHGALRTFLAPKDTDWMTRRDRRLARRPIPSRTLGGS